MTLDQHGFNVDSTLPTGMGGGTDGKKYCCLSFLQTNNSDCADVKINSSSWIEA